MTKIEQKKAAREFADFWFNKGDEKQETARFWIQLLQNEAIHFYKEYEYD